MVVGEYESSVLFNVMKKASTFWLGTRLTFSVLNAIPQKQDVS